MAAMPKWKESCTYVAFAISIIGMVFASSFGEAAYILPCLLAGFLCLIGVYDFKELRANVFSPLILMMAAVIGVANALASTGFTTMVGEGVASLMGGNVNYFVLILVFCLLTSACATLTGASIGSLFVFAPIAIATCTSLGINPAGVASCHDRFCMGRRLPAHRRSAGYDLRHGQIQDVSILQICHSDVPVPDRRSGCWRGHHVPRLITDNKAAQHIRRAARPFLYTERL